MYNTGYDLFHLILKSKARQHDLMDGRLKLSPTSLTAYNIKCEAEVLRGRLFPGEDNMLHSIPRQH